MSVDVLQNNPAFFSGISIGITWKFDGSVWVVVLSFYCINTNPNDTETNATGRSVLNDSSEHQTS